MTTNISWLSFKTSFENHAVQHQIIVSAKGDLAEATSTLYDALHELDNLDLDIIIAETFPDFGLGKSINDRLQRAAHLS